MRAKAFRVWRVIPAQGRDGLAWIARVLTLLLPLALAACQQHAFTAGTPEHVAALVSRGYDCGLSVQRGRVVAAWRGEERRRLIATNQALAVRSYNLPMACGPQEREQVARELAALAR